MSAGTLKLEAMTSADGGQVGPARASEATGIKDAMKAKR